ncbi:MAG: hypothetical protein QXX83_10020 [Thermofilum sp.]
MSAVLIDYDAHELAMLLINRVAFGERVTRDELRIRNIYQFIWSFPPETGLRIAGEAAERAKRTRIAGASKSTRRAAERFLREVKEDWWRVLREPPEWLRNLTYQYLVAEVYARPRAVWIDTVLMDAEAFNDIPIYIDKGVAYRLKPSEVGPPPYKLSPWVSDLARYVAREHARVDVDAGVIELFGRRLYCDLNDLLAFASLTWHGELLRQLNERVEAMIAESAARALGVDAGKVKVSSTSYRPRYSNVDTVTTKITVAASTLVKAFSSVQLPTRGYAVIKIERREDSAWALPEVDVTIPVAVGQSTKRFSATIRLSKPTMVHEVMLSEDFRRGVSWAIQAAKTYLDELKAVLATLERIDASNRELELQNSIHVEHGSKGTLSVTMKGNHEDAWFLLDYFRHFGAGELEDPRVILYVSVELSDLPLARAVLYHLLKEPPEVPVVELKSMEVKEVEDGKGRITADAIFRSVDDAFGFMKRFVRRVRELSEKLSRERRFAKLSAEEALALHLATLITGNGNLPLLLGKSPIDLKDRVFALLRAHDPSFSWDMLDEASRVVQALVQAGRLSVNSRMEPVLGGRTIREIVAELGVDSEVNPETLSSEIASMALEAGGFRALEAMVSEAGKIPWDVVERICKGRVSLSELTLPLKGKPVVHYFDAETKKRLIDMMGPYILAKILLNPTLGEHFRDVADYVERKILESGDPGALTAYVYKRRPEILGGASVELIADDYSDTVALKLNEFYFQVADVERGIFIVYGKEEKEGVALEARDLPEAYEKARAVYRDAARTVKLLHSAAHALRSLGYAIVHRSISLNDETVALTKIVSRRNGGVYYVSVDEGMKPLLLGRGGTVEVKARAPALS